MNTPKTTITVCMGSSCFARGNMDNLEFIEKYIREHNLNAKIELSGSRCEEKCADGPNILINGVRHNHVNIKKLKELLKNE
ncbi:MAG: (2Fe-2S) ferredoxin domain-containing protein [Candidatus Gastranaerophilales bacterium]|nr:(2Fe-2S) ferredoxin domain-containing protein [Candidatus Gastranaerophilales bacterium]